MQHKFQYIKSTIWKFELLVSVSRTKMKLSSLLFCSTRVWQSSLTSIIDFRVTGRLPLQPTVPRNASSPKWQYLRKLHKKPEPQLKDLKNLPIASEAASWSWHALLKILRRGYGHTIVWQGWKRFNMLLTRVLSCSIFSSRFPSYR